MAVYEYRAMPAPRKGKAGKGVKGSAAKLANAISELMNEMAADGWEYLRADTLPCEERQGLTSKTVKYHSMLVFRRATGAVEAQEEPLAIEHHEPESEHEPQQDMVDEGYDDEVEETTASDVIDNRLRAIRESVD